MKFIVRALLMRKRISRYMLQRVFVAVGNREYGIHSQEIWTSKNPWLRPSKVCLDATFAADTGSSFGAGTEASKANANQETKERSLRLRLRRALQRRLFKRGRSIRIMVG